MKRTSGCLGDPATASRRTVAVYRPETSVANRIVQKLRERGVKRITVACTHGLFTGSAIARLRAQPDIDEIVTTDTVPMEEEKRLPNMHVLSVAPLLAEAIRRIHLGESVSDMFDTMD